MTVTYSPRYPIEDLELDSQLVNVYEANGVTRIDQLRLDVYDIHYDGVDDRPGTVVIVGTVTVDHKGQERTVACVLHTNLKGDPGGWGQAVEVALRVTESEWRLLNSYASREERST